MNKKMIIGAAAVLLVILVIALVSCNGNESKNGPAGGTGDDSNPVLEDSIFDGEPGDESEGTGAADDTEGTGAPGTEADVQNQGGSSGQPADVSKGNEPEPVEPTTSEDTTKPADTSKPGTTTKPADTSKPGTTTKPEDTSKPGTTTKPVEPSAPDAPSKPADPKPGDPTPDEPSKPVEPSQPSQPSKPSEPSNPSTPSKPETPAEPGELDYETFQDMAPADQQAYMESFGDIEAFFNWYNAAKEKYEKEHPSIEIGGNGTIDMEQIMGGNN